MKAVQKTAMAMFRYLGASENAARAGAKELAPRLSAALSGSARGEKKAFLQALENLTKENCNVDKEHKILLKTLGSFEDKSMRGEMKRVSKAINDGSFFDPQFKRSPSLGMKSRERINSDLSLYNSLTLSMGARRGVISMNKELPNIIGESINGIGTLKPEQVSRVVDDVMKEVAKERVTLMGRTFAYPFTKAVSYFLPSSTRRAITKLTKLPKSQFKNEYYKYLTETRDIAGRAPTEVQISSKSAGFNIANLLSNKQSCEGGFDMIANKIEFTKEFSNLSRACQASLLSHELRHFEQADSVIRTFGIDRYVSAQKTRMLNTAYRDFGTTKTKKEIIEMVDKLFKDNKIEEQIRASFANSMQAPAISASSKTGIKAAKYLEGIENYGGISRNGFVTTVTKEYFNNPLERNAYFTGYKSGFVVKLLESLNLRSV